MGQRGQSLVQSLASLAILSVVVLVFTAMMTNQQKQTAILADKLASLDIERVITGTLSDGSVCSQLFAGATPVEINPSNLAATVFPNLDQIPSSINVGARPAVMTNGSVSASPLSPRLFVQSISVDRLECATSPCTPTTNGFNAQIVVTFDDTRTAGPIAPLRFPIFLRTLGPPGVQTVNSCLGGGGNGAIQRMVVDSPNQTCGGSPSHTNCPGMPATVVANCPPGYEVTGCGYILSQYSPTPNDSNGNWESDFHSNSPDDLTIMGNGCATHAGGAPGCGVCFRAQAICIRIQ